MKRFFAHPAFTLIELLVSIGIIAILIAIALPALSSARRRASDTAALSGLRQTGTAMESYVQRYGGWLPWAPDGASFRVSPELPPRATITPGYWGLSIYWSSLFHEVAPWPEWFHLWAFPDPRRSESQPWLVDSGSGSPFSNGVTSLTYSRALYSRPEIWEPGELITDWESVFRAVRMSEVRYPSSKVSLFDSELCVRVRCEDPLTAKRAMLFLDGHAAEHALGDAVAPAPPRLEYFNGQADPVEDTAGGAYGRDY